MKKSELRQIIKEEISTVIREDLEMDAPYDIIQNTLKQLAGYWPADIKNNLDNLGAEGFKKQLDNLKPYIDQYFTKK